MTAFVQAQEHWQAGVPTSLRGVKVVMISLVAIFIGVFLLWSLVAPIASAIVAQGVFVKTGFNQTIQHRNGGVVKQIHVAEGDFVTAGDLILTLDGTIDRAAHDRLQARLDRLLATEARLIAQSRGASELNFPEALNAHRSEPRIAALISDHVAEFDAGRARHDAEIAMLEERKSALKQQALGYQAQADAAAAELKIIRGRIADLQPLVEDGVVTRKELQTAQGDEAELSGREGEMIARVAQSRNEIVETEREIVGQMARRAEDGASDLTKVRGELSETREQMFATQRVLDEIEVFAPADGEVVRLSVNTVGGVVEPGAAIAELLPTSNPLIIEARIVPDDIDSVYRDQVAEIFVTAFDRDMAKRMDASVIYVSADRRVDEQSGEPYYTARLELAAEEEAVSDFAKIQAGMQAEVYIGTGERSFAEYLLRPLTDSLRRAFREQ